MATLWDHVRAVLICAHLAAITVAAMPTPQGDLTPQRKRDPQVRMALEPWTGLVIRLGLADDEETALDWLFDRGADLVAARQTAMGPTAKYLAFTGNGQSWRMFGVAPARHGRLQIKGMRPDGTWEFLYNEHQGPDWGWQILEHGRIRSLRSSFSAREMRGRYKSFARFIGHRALEENPEYEMVRVQYTAVWIPDPATLRAQGGLTEKKVFWPIDVQREQE